MTKKEFMEIIKDWDDDEEVVFKATKDDGTGYPEYYYRKIGTIHYDGENVTYIAVPFKGSEVPKNKFAYFIH